MISAEEARRLLGGSTPGPWTQGWEDNSGWVAFVTEDGVSAEHEWQVITATEAHPGTEAFDANLIAAAPDLAATVIAQAEQIAEARETVNDLHAFGLLQTPDADLLLLHLKDQP